MEYAERDKSMDNVIIGLKPADAAARLEADFAGINQRAQNLKNTLGDLQVKTLVVLTKVDPDLATAIKATQAELGGISKLMDLVGTKAEEFFADYEK